jgi:hypothetical protein
LRQSCCSTSKSSVRVALARSVQNGGRRSAPERFGVSALGTTSGAASGGAAAAGSAVVTAPVTPAASAAARAARAQGRELGLRRRRRCLGLDGRLRRRGLHRGPLREPVLDGALLRGLVERDEEVVPVRGGVGGGLAVDLAGDDLLDQRLREGLHLEELALGDRVDDLLGAVLADEIGDAGVVDHHLDRRDPPAVDLREQPLRDHAAQDAGHDRADLRLLDAGEKLDHAAERLGGVDRVHRREHEVAGLGRLQRGLRRLRVAKLADQDHVRVLPQRASKRLLERLGVEPDLTLVDDAAVVGMDDLDRVLDRDDVLLPRPVHVVDHRRERRRLPRAGRAGHEDEPAVLLGELPHAVRQAQLVEVRHRAGDDAKGERDRAALAEGVHAEARQLVGGVRDVEVARLVELLQLRRRHRADALERDEQMALRQGRPLRHLAERPVAPDDRRPVQLEVDVGRAELDGACKEGVQIHAATLHRQRAAVA